MSWSSQEHTGGSARPHLAASRITGRALLAQLVEHLHGKEGVSGSSPEEGSVRKAPQMRGFSFAQQLGRVEVRR